MPDAIIAALKNEEDPKECLRRMVRTGLINSVSVNGVVVYGRHYLTKRAIRLAYKKKEKK